MKQNDIHSFPGFREKYTKDFFTYPIILEKYWYLLTGSEQKALDFILRQTLGFQKTSDPIGHDQFVNGIGERTKGAGISRAQAYRVIKTLEEKGFIIVKKRRYRPSIIRLRISEEKEEEVESETGECDEEIEKLIRMFEPICPHNIEGFLQSKKEIGAMERLRGYYTFEELMELLTKVVEFYGYPYVPVITSPIELEKKIAKFIPATQRDPY